MKLAKSIKNIYNQFSTPGKILLFIVLLLMVVVFFRKIVPQKEGYVNSEKFVYKQDVDVYDNFYADIYDHLVFNEIKNNYEVGSIINSTNPTQKSVIADIGCGTGDHINQLSEHNLNILGIDISPSMIEKAKEKYPNIKERFKKANGLDNHIFQYNTLTHILCLYFTIYFFKDKTIFFKNCMDWLMPGGYLIVHLVDREKFDPILPPGNPLYVVSPQKYSKERITTTKITFNDFVYNADFKLDEEKDIAIFEEKFKFNNGTSRKQEQHLYMEDMDDIVQMAQNAGFLVHAKINLVKCAYEHQYLYVFIKP